MTLVDRKTRTRAPRIHRGAHPRRRPAPGTRDRERPGARWRVAAPARDPQAQPIQATPTEPKPEPTGDKRVPPSGPQRPAPPITKQVPTGPPEVAPKMGQPKPEREPPGGGWLVLIGAIFGLAVLKELFGRAGRPVVGSVKSVSPHVPPSYWMAGAVATLGRIGARVLRTGL